jgi:uncharacterized protein YegJ (DUF2314 family)
MQKTNRRTFPKMAPSGYSIALLAVTAICCAVWPARADHPLSKDLRKPKDNAEYQPKNNGEYPVSNTDQAMHAANESARRTVRQFIRALKNPVAGQTDFEVKKPFVEGGEVEHIWLSDVKLVGNRFEGTVDNTPRKVTGIKLGQRCSVNPNEISDWAYIDNGKLVGGYTIRAHYNALTPAEQAEFKRRADFQF